MIKKWTSAAIAYLLVVIIGYGIYSATIQPDPSPQHNGERSHQEE